MTLKLPNSEHPDEAGTEYGTLELTYYPVPQFDREYFILVGQNGNSVLPTVIRGDLPSVL